MPLASGHRDAGPERAGRRRRRRVRQVVSAKAPLGGFALHKALPQIFDGEIDVFEDLRARSNSGGLPLKIELVRLQHEINRIHNPPTEFLKKAVARLCALDGSRHSDIRFDCLAKSVPPLYANSQYGVALKAIYAMLELARLCGRPDWARLAENFAGALEGERGNIAEAVIHYQRALQLAHELNDPSALAAVMTNLGILFQYAGLYRDAIPMHLGAARTAGDPAAKQNIPSSYSNLAQCYLAIGDIENARRAIALSLKLSIEPKSTYEAHRRTIREWTFVDVALEDRDVREAGVHASRCEHYAVQSQGTGSAFLARLARGLLEVHSGRPADGIYRLEQCAAEALRWDEAKQTDAIVTLIKAYEALKRPEAALSYLNSYMSRLASRRKSQVSALIGSGFEVSQDDFIDLSAWNFRHARLHAEVLRREIVSTRRDVLERLATAATLKEDPSGRHSYRVGKLAALMAQDLGWTSDRADLIVTAARLHDIGKIGIPDRILASKQLQEAERRFMQSHTTLGAELLSKSEIPELKMAEEVARHHHEFWDGSGYPSGLLGERIPISARIVAIGDVFDALTHGRPYADAWAVDDALFEINRLAGRHFDPDLAARFVNLIARLRSQHGDLESFLGLAGDDSSFLQARRNINAILTQANEVLQRGSFENIDRDSISAMDPS